jgi:plasmid maintenance system antidote protein VapI
VAAQLGVTPQQVMHAFATVKRAAGRYPVSDGHVVRALAEQLHVTRAQARQALGQLAIGPDRATQSAAATPPGWAVNALAAQLHITRQRARWVLAELDRMTARDRGVDPGSPAFARLSRALDMTPADLAHALDRWKQSLPASAPSPSPSAPQPGASPTK